MPSNIEVAQAAKLHRITAVAREKLGISEEHLEPYGHYKAKVSLKYLEGLARAIRAAAQPPEARYARGQGVGPPGLEPGTKGL